MEADVRRSRSASEVLFLEAVQVAVQERWFNFGRFLITARVVDTRWVLRSVGATYKAIGETPEAVEAVERAEANVKAFREESPAVARGKRYAEVADDHIAESAEQYLEVLRKQIGELPDRVKREVDLRLCEQHRRRVVGGMKHKSTGLFNERLHSHSMLGLALSGGGIRSASFSIGVLQALAKRGALPAFNFISSVSGGGYAASWFMAWAYRHKEGTEGVAAVLRSPKGSESGPLWWVRRHSSYLAPRQSLASAGDAMALLVSYFFNWIPVFALICSALVSVLLAFHTLATVATGLVGLDPDRQRYGIYAAAMALVGLIALMRRLTMFRRQPAQPARDPSDLFMVVILLFLAPAVVLSVTAPMLAQAAVSGRLHAHWMEVAQIHLPLLSTFWSGTFFWLMVYLLGILLAYMAGAESVTRRIDSWRYKYSSDGVPHRPKLDVVPVPLPMTVIGVVLGALSGAALTEHVLAQSGLASVERVVIAFGPIVVFQIIVVSELSTAFLSTGYMREVDRAWSARVGAWMLSGAGLWLVCSALALLPDDLLRFWRDLSPEAQWTSAIAFGVVVLALFEREHFVSVYVLIALAFIITISAAVVSPLVAFVHAQAGGHVWAALVLSVLLTILLAALIDVNRFSLHSLYREGLVRTFLAASRLGPTNSKVQAPAGVSDEERGQFEARAADPVTGIDENDNPAIAWLRPRSDRPLPVFLLNAAVNGESDTDNSGKAPQQWPYTFSQYFCGSPADGIGYTKSEGVFLGPRRRSLTLGTAMAVSGAAVSPTAGRVTHPVRAFVFGLLNARLGLWVRNPSHPNPTSEEKTELSGFTVILEMLGLRQRFKRWIHLSDGGHFENLGVYELLRRGCVRIVAIDGSCDPSSHMSDLANAIRRARIDLGIIVRNPIDSDFRTEKSPTNAHEEPKQPSESEPGGSGTASESTKNAESGAAGRPESARLAAEDREPAAGNDASTLHDPLGRGNSVWRWFTIDYGPGLPLGRLLYIKPSLLGSTMLPIEVHHYAELSKSFPHETTADQFFTEAQMEAYRSLGQACGEEALQTAVKLWSPDDRRTDQGLAIRIASRFRSA